MKTLLTVIALVIFTFFVTDLYSGDLSAELSRGFAEIDMSRIHTNMAALQGEPRAATALVLRNSYGTMRINQNDELVMEAQFLEGKRSTTSLPAAFNYDTGTTVEGKEVCVVKRGNTVSLGEPPCR